MIFRFLPAAFFLFVFAAFPMELIAQKGNEDPVLFSVGNNDVHVSEFKYVYEKSNGESADYSEESVKEFLDLYRKFKLKVADAKAQGMAEDGQLDAELAQYRNQLADKYMSDDAMLDRLTKELYNRMKWDIDVSHIQRSVPPNAPDYIREQSIEKLEEAKKALASGVDFSAVAKKYSQDRSVTENGGHLGYRRAKLPDGFYELETAIYNTEPGEVAGPVQSRVGYHLIKVNERKPDPGTIEVAHILIRKPREGLPDSSQQVIHQIYEELKKGGEFGKLAQTYSDDKNNRRQDGYLGKFKTGTYDPAFEKAAFNIPEDGAYSSPVQTDFGWHIIKRLSLDELGDYESEKLRLEDKVRNDSRYKLAQEALIERVKKEEDFQVLEVSNKELLEVLTEDVFQVNWKAPSSYDNRGLFQIRDSVYTLKSFINYLAQNLDARYQRSVVEDPESKIGHILDGYADYEILNFEKAHLEDKYPAFREIMREYREGIMLFEISKNKIWDRAGQDTAGLRKYYEQHQSQFHTPRSVKYDEYKVNTSNTRVLAKVEKLIRKKEPGKVLKKLNKAAEVVTHAQQEIKEDEFEELYGTEGEKLTNDNVYRKTDSSKGVTVFGQIQNIEPGEPLPFQEARGAVMSEYQKHLENQWVAELLNKYDVDTNEKVLRSIIRS